MNTPKAKEGRAVSRAALARVPGTPKAMSVGAGKRASRASLGRAQVKRRAASAKASPWLARDATAEHWKANETVHPTGEGLPAAELGAFCPNADATDIAHGDRDETGRKLRANTYKGRPVPPRAGRTRRRYPPELLNARGYLQGAEADETHRRLAWLYREGLVDRDPTAARPLPWHLLLHGMSGAEARELLQPRTSVEQTTEELSLERRASQIIASGRRASP